MAARKRRKKKKSCVGRPSKKKTVRSNESRVKKARKRVDDAKDALAMAEEKYRHSEACKKIRRKKN